MQQWVNQVWYHGHSAKYLLWPLSLIFGLVSFVRRLLFKLGLKSAHKLPVPVIVVGNITAGGSGKTPTVIYLIELLKQHGLRPGVISRGYGAKIDGVKTVTLDDSPQTVGDEPYMIFLRTGVPFVVGSRRTEAAQTLLANVAVDVIISDDGLQHYALARDIEIALVDGQRRYGNELLIPAGPLREGLWRLNSIDWIINNGGPSQSGEQLMMLDTSPLKPVTSLVSFDKIVNNPDATAELLAPQKVFAMAGIGNPKRFFQSLEALGFTLVEQIEFEDHQAFDEETLTRLSLQYPLVMTEKDAVKCREFANKNWWFLPVNAKLNPEFDHALIERVTQLIKHKKEH